jgi:membrane fusion protein (multidrug efflux system)
MNTATTPDTGSTANPQGGKRRRILSILAIAFLVIGAVWFLLQHFVLALREKTDDAYVAGNQVAITSQVAGTVTAVRVTNTTRVEAGQVLVQLDPTDAATMLARAEAELGRAVRQVRQQLALSSQYDATVAQRKLELKRAETDLANRAPLVADKAIAGEEVRHAKEAVAIARVALDQAQRQAAAAHALVDGAAVKDNPVVLEARAKYRDAWVAAKRNAIVSPVRGFVAQRNVQLGQHIAPGQPLMMVIPLDDLWIDANFKESQIGNLRIGQPVTINSDLYGSDAPFHGKVIGLAAGTGGAFSLLPAQNASGNWIKVVQRVPVKVSLDKAELAQHPLRIGLSTVVTVDTHDRSGAVLASATEAPSIPATDVYAADLATAGAEADAIIARNLATK